MDFMDNFGSNSVNQTIKNRGLKNQIKDLLIELQSVTFNLEATQDIVAVDFLLCKFNEVEIYSKMKFHHDLQEIRFQFQFLKSGAMEHKNLLLTRFLMRLNNSFSNVKISVNPSNGNIKFSLFIKLANSCQKFWQDIFEYLSSIKNELVSQYLQIAGFLCHQSNSVSSQTKQSQDVKNQLLQLKKYLASSSAYSWKIISDKTDFQKSPYRKAKQNFLRNCKLIKTPSSIKKLLKVYSRPDEAQPQKINPLFSQEDQYIKQKYLKQNSNLSQTHRLVNKFVSTSQMVSNLEKKKNINISFQGTKINVDVKKFKTQAEKQNFIHQKEILQSLPKPAIIGLPTFYFLKDQNGKQIQFLYLTTLTHYQSLLSYMENNKETISLHTKFYLLSQISETLRYLKNNSVLYHNLTPANISIQKGLIVKLSDFSNAIALGKNLISSEKYPYVSLYDSHNKNNLINQKFDVYSLGLIIFQIMNGKQYVLSSMIHEEANLIGRNPILSQQKIGKDDHILSKLIMQCALQACQHNQVLEMNATDSLNKRTAQLKEKQSKTQKRPYMDWMDIIIKYSHEKIVEWI